MPNIRVKQEESLSIKLSHLLGIDQFRRLDLYFLLPKEMGIGPHTLTEEDYFYGSIVGRRSYYSEGLHLPLVQTRFISQSKGSLAQFRLYQNLFSYQFAIAVEADSRELSQLQDPAEFYSGLVILCDQIEKLLRKFRRNEPEEPKWVSYFENADNYLSWLCEQRLLKLLAHAPRSSEHSDIVNRVVELCRQENEYRNQRQYNSAQTRSEPNRISNKMLLLRRLIQQGVVLKEEQKPLGIGVKKFATGIATSLIMIIVSSLILKAQGVFSGLTIVLVLVLSVIYGFREIFKDDFRNAIWRWLRKGKPRWSRTLRDTTSKSVVVRQLVWLDYLKPKALPKEVTEILSRRNRQNQVDVEVLHYGVTSRVRVSEFLSGYSTIKEQLTFSLAPFARYLERGKSKIYKETDGKISNDSVERRYQVNLVVKLIEDKAAPKFARYKITLSRSQIVDIAEIKLPAGICPIASHSAEPPKTDLSTL
ncbi:hypothetical protein [Shewanella gelidii]|uniref:Uncharacterized protein n=1 Tax=Shewanella gelidii TaxID=1642821 RepID=A0A917K103_9GAMM|nr:hypothetical protein [Shewanella gelidii]MCL1099322.1 hypothetical protein [Shewanella gelidii]GGI91986.1 hypothetical protein GCM10009332_31610 [Shewanella gelidii]